MNEITSVHEAEKFLKRCDPALRKGGRLTLQAAVILLGSAAGLFKQNVDDIQAATGYRRDHIRAVVNRLKANKIWHKGKTVGEWMRKDTGDMAFWLDVAVAMGWLRRWDG